MERRRPLLHVTLTITLRKRVSTPELLRKRHVSKMAVAERPRDSLRTMLFVRPVSISLGYQTLEEQVEAVASYTVHIHTRGCAYLLLRLR